MSFRGPQPGSRKAEMLLLIEQIALDLKYEYEDARNEETKESLRRALRLLSARRRAVETPVCKHTDCSEPAYKGGLKPYCLRHAKEHYGKGESKPTRQQDFRPGLRDALVTGRK